MTEFASGTYGPEHAVNATQPRSIEQDDMAACFARITFLRMFAAARRMASARRSKDPNWVFAMEFFALGSTFAWHMCLQMWIDPDARSAEVALQ